MQSILPVLPLARIPIAMATGAGAGCPKTLDLPEAAAVYPLASIILTQDGHDALLHAAARVIDEQSDWRELWANRGELARHIYTHLLANLVSFHVGGRWLPPDNEWMEDRCVPSKRMQEIVAAYEERVPHVADYVLLGTRCIRLTAAPNGSLAVGGAPTCGSAPATWKLF
jgi:hypothetical protein